jgi:hypothetical protein
MMICKCKKAFDITPCPPCTRKQLRECHQCGALRRIRALKKCNLSKCAKCKGICSDCKAKEISNCDHCNKDVPLNHECVPLFNEHWSFKKFSAYPPPIRTVGSKFVICPDCRSTIAYNVYARHQQRQHYDIAPCDLYSRADGLDEHECKYCCYTMYDAVNVNEHMKTHVLEKQHECKFGCGARFSRANQEANHRQVAHQQKPRAKAPKRRRVGRQIVRVQKNQKIEFLE